jgi:hypothetical protein
MGRRQLAWIRDIDFGQRLQTFLISAIAMVLVIRTQLWLTNYPQLGGHGLHIAHLLWGGLFMAITIGMLLVYRSRAVYTWAAVLGGIGFGFFIDELGKFITEDNDYFYRPAAALIYLIFIGIFLFIRWFDRRKGLTATEAVANAIGILSGAASGDLNERDRQRALQLLDQVDDDTPLVANTRLLLEEVRALPAPQPSRIDRFVTRTQDWYLGLVEQQWFTRLVCWLVGFWAAFTMLAMLGIVLSFFIDLDVDDVDKLTFANWAGLISSTVSAALVLAGIRRILGGRRQAGYALFERSFLVAIFITSVFSFYESQFGAVFGLGLNVLLLFTFGRMARAEQNQADSLAQA